MPRFQLHCGRFPLHASETGVCFFLVFSGAAKSQKPIFLAQLRPPCGLAQLRATRKLYLGFHECSTWFDISNSFGIKRFKPTSVSQRQENQSHGSSSGWIGSRGHVPKLLRYPGDVSKQNCFDQNHTEYQYISGLGWILIFDQPWISLKEKKGRVGQKNWTVLQFVKVH